MKISRNVRLLVVLVLMIVGVLSYTLLRAQEQNTSDDTAPTQFVNYEGAVSSIDIEGMATDNPGLYTLETGNGVYTVSIASAESDCSPEAIILPGLKEGDAAMVRGLLAPDRMTIEVCEPGTYLKRGY